MGELPAPYENNNGQVSSEPGRKIGRATFLLDAASTGRESFLALDQSVVEELCAERSCQLSLAMRVVGAFSTEPLSSTIVGPCKFDYNSSSGEWVRGAGCSTEVLSGKDGDSAAGVGNKGADIIVVSGEGCLLADAGIRKAVGTNNEILERDHAKGLFLIAAPSRIESGIRRFKCDLDIE